MARKLLAMSWWPGSPDEIFKDPSFLQDADHLLAIDGAVFDRALTAMRQETGFLDGEGLGNLLKKAGLEDDDQQGALIDFRRNLSGDRLGPFEQVLISMKDALKARGKSHAELTTFEARVRDLCEPVNALILQAKAESLAAATGHDCVTFRFLTDLRPVFNATRDRVEGMLPLTTLRIVSRSMASDEDYADERVHEVHLSEAQLVRLCTAAESAQRKLESLRTKLAAASIFIPRVTRFTEDGHDIPIESEDN